MENSGDTTTIYRCGSTGAVVAEIQGRLADLGYYQGPVDGAFGGGTASAVKLFQKFAGLEPDGCVGAQTWEVLFHEPWPAPPPGDCLNESLEWRCLALTGSFETGMSPPDCFAAVTGDFDGQGMSFGALQWNMGQGTLQSLLQTMMDEHRDVMEEVFHDRLPEIERLLASPYMATWLEWARSVQAKRHRIVEPWLGLFKTLGRTYECQMAQMGHAGGYMSRARNLCRRLRLSSERALALLFDVTVQNGGIRTATLKRLDGESAEKTETDRLRLIANLVADGASSRWAEDVRARKLAIANGAGVVHGRHYDIEAQYGIRLSAQAAL